MGQIPSYPGKGFSKHIKDILMCSNNQQHQPISSINSSMLNKNRNQYNSMLNKNGNQYHTVIDNRTRTLTTLSPFATNTSETCRYE